MTSLFRFGFNLLNGRGPQQEDDHEGDEEFFDNGSQSRGLKHASRIGVYTVPYHLIPIPNRSGETGGARNVCVYPMCTERYIRIGADCLAKGRVRIKAEDLS